MVSLSSLLLTRFPAWVALCLGLFVITPGHATTPREPLIPPLPPEWQPVRLVVPEPEALPVRLDRVAIDTEIHGGQALTRIELRFFNPNQRVLEGELQFPLLDGQQVVGLAMDVDGRLRDAVPVEKAKGRQVFEDVIRQRIDPALLEATAGNHYKLRVYPIPSQGAKRVVLRIMENLPLVDGQLSLRLALGYAEALAQLDLRIRVFSSQQPIALGGEPDALVFARRGEIYEARLTREQYRGRDLVQIRVPAARQASASSQSLDGTTWFRAEIPAPAAESQPRTLPRRVLLLWDASGSAAGRDPSRELSLLDRYFFRMGEGEVVLVRFRDALEPAETFPVEQGDWSALRQALKATVYDGATRLDLLRPVAGVQEALLVSDGLANYGEAVLPELGVPTFCISSRPGADSAALGLISRRSGGRYLDLSRLDREQAAALLLAQTVELSGLGGEGVSRLVSESSLPVDGRFLVAGAAVGNDARLEVVLRFPDGSQKTMEVPIPAASESSLAALTWARLRLKELEGERELRRGEIRRLGQAFRLPTAETSLIVLDRVEDYAQYRIEPPPELRDAYDRLVAAAEQQEKQARGAHLEQVVELFRAKQEWWDKDFPKGKPPAPKVERSAAPGGMIAGSRARMAAPAPMVSESGFEARDMAAPAAEPEAPALEAPEESGQSAVTIALKKWSSDAPYMDRFRSASAQELYPIYLDERPDWTNSSAFFLDAADLLFEREQPGLALRVLSNLAEMDLENRHLLRILAYRLLQAGYPEPAIPVLRKVLELAPDEPQSWRDLGLAYQAAGRSQKAVDQLYRVVEGRWNPRFPEIELIALGELNAILATTDTLVDTGHIDQRLLRNLPLDLRVVLTWDADNTDMDLWVTDPNGEKSYYGNRLSYQGGRVSPDFTTGYGPEEYSLKRAKPGRYLVQANFFGHSQQVVTGATTLQLDLFTHFGTPEQRRESVTLRLQGAKDVVTVGEFVVGNDGRTVGP